MNFFDGFLFVILSAKMTKRKSSYVFYTEVVKGLSRKHGGLEAVAAKLHTTVRTLYRTINSDSRNGRLCRKNFVL